MTAAGLAGYAIGVAAALRAPLWLHGPRLAALVKDQEEARATEGREARAAVRAAHGALRLLGRLHLPWWRNTCLYRAVAECLVLRHYGIRCRVELGVTRGPDAAAPVAAHAWVVGPDGASPAAGDSLVVLTGRG